MSNTKTVKHELIDFMSLEDLMKSDEHIEWRINNFLPKGCIAVISGITGVKRSFFLQQMGLALATGEDFLAYRIPEKCTVAMYEAELTKGELKERASHMLNIYPMTDNLLFNTKYTLLLGRYDDGGALIYTMNELNIDVCILDPLYMLHTGNVIDEKDMMKVFRPLEKHCLETGRNFILAGHSTKTSDSTTSSNRGASGGAVKGTSAQVQVASYVWTLSDSFLKTNSGVLTFEKTRDMPRPDNLSLEFRDDTNTFLPTKVKDEERLEWLRIKKPKDRENANELLKRWYRIGQSKAYELSKKYFEQTPELVSV
ncbi:AAA family ATPase [Chloroflexota bacterium]